MAQELVRKGRYDKPFNYEQQVPKSLIHQGISNSPTGTSIIMVYQQQGILSDTSIRPLQINFWFLVRRPHPFLCLHPQYSSHAAVRRYGGPESKG